MMTLVDAFEKAKSIFGEGAGVSYTKCLGPAQRENKSIFLHEKINVSLVGSVTTWNRDLPSPTWEQVFEIALAGKENNDRRDAQTDIHHS